MDTIHVAVTYNETFNSWTFQKSLQTHKFYASKNSNVGSTYFRLQYFRFMFPSEVELVSSVELFLFLKLEFCLCNKTDCIILV